MVLAQYYNFVRLGRDGYTYVMKQMQQNAQALAANLRDSGRFEVIGDDLEQLPLVAFRLPGDHASYDESDIAWQLSAERGWMVPAYTLPPNAEKVKIMRALVKETMSREQVERLTRDIADACATLDKKGGAHQTEREQTKIGHRVLRGGSVADRPNILIIWGDDIGISNLSCYSDGLMGYRTPNIDRIAAEGVRFTDYYGEQSCTAGRAAFITGQNPYRTGLTKVGMPGADIGLRAEDPTIATALKALGYATGQFGKNHFGDRDEFLPTAHGFDEFFGNLYHLNAEEEPEHPDYPSEEDFPNFRKRFGPRGVIHAWADPEAEGGQRIEDTGPLTKERMKTIDDEVLPEALRFMTDAQESDTPFFVWLNTTHMHFRTHVKDGSRGRAGRWQSDVPRHHVRPRRARGPSARPPRRDGPGRQHDRHVLHRQRSAHEHLARCRHDAVPQREELQLGRRVPRAGDGALARSNPGGPGAQRHRQPRRLVRHAARGGGGHRRRRPAQGREPTSAGPPTRCTSTATTSSTTSPVPADESPRQHFFYVSDDGDLTALRYDNWKFVFLEQRVPGTLSIWARSLRRAAVPPRSSTCGPTPTSGPTSRRTPTTTGCSTTSGC